MKSVGSTDTILPSSPFVLSGAEQLGAGLPLSSQRKHICKENEPQQEIPLAWYFFFKANFAGHGGSLCLSK